MHRHSRIEMDADHVCEPCQRDFTLAAFESAVVQLAYVALTIPNALADADFLTHVEMAQDYIDQIRDAMKFAPRVGE